MIAAAVFTVAALTGAILSAAAPAVPEEPLAGGDDAAAVTQYDYPGAREAGTRAAGTRAFARSLIYSGAAGLAVSIAGLIMISRRRRLW